MNMENDKSFTMTTSGMRWMLLVASILVLIIGSSLFFLPLQTDVYFSWTIGSPLTAVFLGGAYLSAFIIELVASREILWANARVAVPAVFVFTALTFIVTLLHLDKFHFDSPAWNTVVGTWVWLLVYLTVPIIMAALWVKQSSRPGEDPPRHMLLPLWARIILLAQGALLVISGILLLLTPTTMIPVWAWPLTPLTAQAIGAWGIGVGTAALHMAKENDWQRNRAGSAGLLTFGLLQLINLARFGDEFILNSVVGILYVIILLSTVAIGSFGMYKNQG